MSANPKIPRAYVARHGETEWSLTGQHTGMSDIPLTANGVDQARALAGRIADLSFDKAWTSPLIRAHKTADLALGDRLKIEVDPDLAEWDYGDYDGLTSDEIHAKNPDWFLFRDGCPHGESPEAVTARADRVVAKLKAAGGTTIVFSHGHFSRALAVRWLGIPISNARYFDVGTAALGCLSYEHEELNDPVIELWNDHRHAEHASDG